MSSSSRWGNPAAPQAQAATKVEKQISQTALKLKAMSQLRQVLRSSPNRGALAFTLGRDLLIVLRYLPIGIMNKLQQFTVGVEAGSTSGMFRSASSTSSTIGNNSEHKSDDSSNSSNRNQTTSSGPQQSPGDKDKDSNKDSIIVDKSILNATTTPSNSSTPVGTPFKTLPKVVGQQNQSVLKNVIEMNTQNNRVIDAKKIEQTTTLNLNEIIAEEVAELKQVPEKRSETTVGSKFLETNLYWQNIESRTKHLVLMVQKDLSTSDSGSKHNLITHLDELFSHIYQHNETRNTAIECGALKVLIKVMKTHKDSYIVHRTREVLALLGNNPPTKGKGIKILSIDGGGVRGLVALEVLRSIERITGKRTHELFDYVCGVSTGSILAFLLGAHKKTLDEAEALYKDLSREIFSQNSFFGNAALLWSHSYYNTPTFERILKNHCGEVPLISLARDPALPRVSAISTVVNQERVSPYVFRTYALPPDVRAKYLGGCRYHMWEAVRASAAAPTYFEEIKLGNYLHQDGGILVNNPTSVAISEAKTIWKNVPLQCVVSLGTGLTLSSSTDKNLNDLLEHGKEGAANYLSWKGKFLKVLDSATDTESVHNTLNELLPHDMYFRFNPYLSEVVRLDEAKADKLDQVQMETRHYLERNVEKVQFACKTLLREKGMSKKLVDWWYHA